VIFNSKTRSLIDIVYWGFVNLNYLVKVKHPLKKKKIKIVLTWLKIKFKFLFFSRLFKLKKEKIFNYKIDFFDYEIFSFLFEEIFYKNEYLFESKNKQPIIFDCGANIGLATIFFKWLFPESKIYSFEPDINTFDLLKKNVLNNNFKNIHLFNKAISNRDGNVSFYNNSLYSGSLIMGTVKREGVDNRSIVKCLSLSKLIQDENINNIDFVKMDIEGSETKVIRDLYKNNCLKKINKLIIEYHHKINNQKSNLSKFLDLFEKSGFEYQIDAKCFPINSENKFQDVILYFYKR
jgi:FkbM family methyltransferase